MNQRKRKSAEMQFQIDLLTADNLKAMMNITTADLQSMTFSKTQRC